MKCEFKIHVGRLTIVFSKIADIFSEFENYLTIGPTVKEARTKNPIMAGEMLNRTYLRNFGNLKRFYIIWKKCVPRKGIDALLVCHDVSFREFIQIELLLRSFQSVGYFHISYVEFANDFYPGKNQSAVDLQKEIVKNIHFNNAYRLRKKGKPPRITFYFNKQNASVQLVIYIRPKRPTKGAQEFVRVEMKVNRDWLKDNHIEVPSDLKRYDS